MFLMQKSFGRIEISEISYWSRCYTLFFNSVLKIAALLLLCCRVGRSATSGDILHQRRLRWHTTRPLLGHPRRAIPRVPRSLTQPIPHHSLQGGRPMGQVWLNIDFLLVVDENHTNFIAQHL